MTHDESTQEENQRQTYVVSQTDKALILNLVRDWAENKWLPACDEFLFNSVFELASAAKARDILRDAVRRLEELRDPALSESTQVSYREADAKHAKILERGDAVQAELHQCDRLIKTIPTISTGCHH